MNSKRENQIVDKYGNLLEILEDNALLLFLVSEQEEPKPILQIPKEKRIGRRVGIVVDNRRIYYRILTHKSHRLYEYDAIAFNKDAIRMLSDTLELLVIDNKIKKNEPSRYILSPETYRYRGTPYKAVDFEEQVMVLEAFFTQRKISGTESAPIRNLINGTAEEVEKGYKALLETLHPFGSTQFFFELIEYGAVPETRLLCTDLKRNYPSNLKVGDFEQANTQYNQLKNKDKYDTHEDLLESCRTLLKVLEPFATISALINHWKEKDEPLNNTLHIRPSLDTYRNTYVSVRDFLNAELVYKEANHKPYIPKS